MVTCPVTRFNHKELTMHATSIVNGVNLGRLSGDDRRRHR